MPNDDLSEITERALVADLARALAEHRAKTSDPEATFARRPLTGLEAAAISDAIGCVSGYRVINAQDAGDPRSPDFLRNMGRELTDIELSDIHVEVVTTMGQFVLLYIRGTEVREG